MSIDRRDFVRLSALTGGAAALGYPAGLMAEEEGHSSPHFSLTREVERAEKPLRILVLGGTGFIGPPEVEYMLKRGHTVTLFNRGRTNSHLFPEVEKLRGDRHAGELDALRGREWDAVIDNPATIPRWVRESAQLLKDSAEYYVHVSTVSVYSDNTIVGLTEDEGPVFELDAAANIVLNRQGLTALLGVEKLLVVQAGDTLLICRRDRAQDLRKLVARLEEEGLTRYI